MAASVADPLDRPPEFPPILGLADGSAEMTTRVRSILHPKYGAWRRFDEFLALNIQGMIAWRAGKSPAAH